MPEIGRRKFAAVSSLSWKQHLFNGLKQAKTGGEIYTQICDYLSESESTHLAIEHQYGQIIKMLIEKLADNLPRESSEGRQAATLFSKIQPSLSLADLQSLAEQIRLFTDTRLSAMTPGTENVHQIFSPTLGEMKDIQSDEIHAETHIQQTDSIAPGQLRLDLSSAETNRAIALAVFDGDKPLGTNLEEQRDRIQDIQAALTLRMEEMIARNKSFGSHLQSELATLRHAASGEKIEQVRGLLLGELGHVIKEQQELIQQFNGAHESLQAFATGNRQLSEELRRVRRLSLTDDLTGLPNRRAFTRRLEDELSRVRRSGHPLALALIDLDRFKSINDVYGHSCGDTILHGFAEIVLTALRQHDMIARYGGEEFAAILPYTNGEEAVITLEKVQAHAANTCFSCEHTALSMPTFSAGIALYLPGDTLKSFINRADEALYRAKRAGRNRIETDDGSRP